MLMRDELQMVRGELQVKDIKMMARPIVAKAQNNAIEP